MITIQLSMIMEQLHIIIFKSKYLYVLMIIFIINLIYLNLAGDYLVAIFVNTPSPLINN